MATSKYFSMIIRKVEHPNLYAFINGKADRGEKKKFICDAAEHVLEKGEEAQQIARLEERLDEIRELLKSGVILQGNESEERVKPESEKVSGLLSALGL